MPASALKPLHGLTLGFDAYYKIAQNPARRGPVRRAHLAHLLQLRQRHRQGCELTASYDEGPWSVYCNRRLAARRWPPTSTRRNSISARRARLHLATTTSPSTTARAGRCRAAPPTPSIGRQRLGDARVGRHAVRQRPAHQRSSPPTTSLPGYAVVNAVAGAKTSHQGLGRRRRSVSTFINLFDNSYQIRDGLGVGVGAPQFGQRRTFLLTLAQKF